MFKFFELLFAAVLSLFSIGILPLSSQAQTLIQTGSQIRDFSEFPLIADKECTTGKILWRESAQVEKNALDEESAEAASQNVISVGCLGQTENFIVVVNTFRKGKPDSYTVVPKGAVVAVMFFVERPKEPGEEPQEQKEPDNSPVLPTNERLRV